MKTAQIIELPRHAGQRVVQDRIKGRHPKTIATIAGAIRKRFNDRYEFKLIAEEIEQIKFHLEMNQKMNLCWETKLAALTDTKMTKEKRSTLVAEIEFNRLPYEVRQPIEDQRAGRGKVLYLSKKR